MFFLNSSIQSMNILESYLSYEILLICKVCVQTKTKLSYSTHSLRHAGVKAQMS